VVDAPLKRAVFLDRDGVLNKVSLRNGKPHPPDSLKDLIIMEGVKEAVDLLRQLEFELVVVTNQPDVARGFLATDDVDLIHGYLGNILQLKYFYTCFHDDSDFCNCRKPLPGLIFEAAASIGIDLAKSFMVGDRWRDIAAGLSAGCSCYFIDYSYTERRPEGAFTSVGSLLEAARHIERCSNEPKS
jgi:D-glycero-D-manno-heptose 1,7-bisphosphate phosphatase